MVTPTMTYMKYHWNMNQMKGECEFACVLCVCMCMCVIKSTKDAFLVHNFNAHFSPPLIQQRTNSSCTFHSQKLQQSAFTEASFFSLSKI